MASPCDPPTCRPSRWTDRYLVETSTSLVDDIKVITLNYTVIDNAYIILSIYIYICWSNIYIYIYKEYIYIYMLVIYIYIYMYSIYIYMDMESQFDEWWMECSTYDQGIYGGPRYIRNICWEKPSWKWDAHPKML